MIYRQGDPVTAVYFIAKGECRVDVRLPPEKPDEDAPMVGLLHSVSLFSWPPICALLICVFVVRIVQAGSKAARTVTVSQLRAGELIVPRTSRGALLV